MKPPARALVGRAQRHRFGDAFDAVAGLTDPGRAFLLNELGDDSRGDEALSKAALGDIWDAKRRQQLRSWFESAFALGWDGVMLGPRELGALVPPARLVPDGRLSPRSLDQRVRVALESAGHSRWSEVLDLTITCLLEMRGLGPTSIAAVLGACFERGLLGLLMGAETYDGSDLAALLGEERRGPRQPVLESLLDAATTDLGTPGADSARRLLATSAPWALEHVSALSELLGGIRDDEDRSIFIALELSTDRRSLAGLAEEFGISSQRVGQRRDRAGLQVREELAAAPAPLQWLVERVRRSLGRAATAQAIEDVLRCLGLHPSTGPEASRSAELLLWLAGPFDPVARCPGWRCVRPDDLFSQTRETLVQDGGVRSFAAIGALLEELGVTKAAVRPWTRACGAVVVDDDLAVWMSGPLADVLERLMDARGRGLTSSECCRFLLEGGRPIEQSDLQRALRGRRFRRVADEVYELVSWPQERPGTRSPKGSGTRQRRPPKSGAAGAGATFRQERVTDIARGAKVSGGALLRGGGGTFHPDQNGQLGLPGVDRPEDDDDGAARMRDAEAGWAVVAADAEDSASCRVWWLARVDSDLLRGDESSVPDGIVRALGIGWRQRRTFSSRYGPVTLANDGTEPSRGSLRPIAMAAGASPGDVLALSFAPEGDVLVTVRAPDSSHEPWLPAATPDRSGPGSQVEDTTEETRGGT
jgi:hypothetical protein